MTMSNDDIQKKFQEVDAKLAALEAPKKKDDPKPKDPPPTQKQE